VKDFWLNDTIKIDHPLADRISVQNSPSHYASENSSEVAFFRCGVFVTRPIEPFTKYAEEEAGDTRVYPWVPNEIIESFLDKYRVST
jgi:hypothetical protein